MAQSQELKNASWHSMSVESVLDTLGASKEGLSDDEVRNRLREFGENKLPERKKKNVLLRFLQHFHNVLIYVLLVAAAVTALMDHWIDASVILAVVIVNAAIGFIQEGKAEKALEGIRKMLSLEALVVRDGNRHKTDADRIVPGDIVILGSGDKIPADIRILKAERFRVEESPLTGESTDVSKDVEPVDEETLIADRTNIAYSGTMVTAGTATGVVVATGENTEIGKITGMISAVEEIKTPLLKKIDRFGLQLSFLILIFAGSFFLFGYFFREYTLIDLFLATISVVVASIPEGLPAIMTITLAIGVQRMARRNAIIRRLPSVETLGSATVICSDKTGTLTRNEMTAKAIWTSDAEYEVEGSGYRPEGKIMSNGEQVDIGADGSLEKLCKCLRLCNDASLDSIDHDDVSSDLVFLGLVGIIDPPRDEVYAAIEECKRAGVRVIMITGDHAVTAGAIARDLGIGNEHGAVTGADLEDMDDDALAEAAMRHNVFARTTPEHKLRLVKALQKNKQLCAMTGDGVNDAPALKQASIGVAMGVKGTEVAKEASEMVLADDNFTSIVNAVEEGRTVYDNIRKTIFFVLPTNGAEALVLIAAIVMGVAMPITPAQILWVNMVTAVTLALALAFEPMEKKVMELPPRDPDERLLGWYFLWRVLFVSILIGGCTLFLYDSMRGGGVDLDAARTVAVNTLVAGQAFYLFNCRKFYESAFTRNLFENYYVFIAVSILIVLQLIFTYVPFMNSLFRTAPFLAGYWIYVLAAGVLVLLAAELEKFLARRFVLA